MTTVCYIAQNVIWSNNVFLANCVQMSCFLFSQCPYTYRMVETLSLCPLIEANNVRKNIFLIWNGTSWNTENCWNFWPNCFGLWGISFWKRKNGSGTPCISHSLEILNPLKMTTQYLFLTLKIMLKSRLICIAFGQKFLKNMFHQQIVLCKGPKVMRTKFIIWTVRP